MHVLYLHPAASYGGASKSLIELYSQLRLDGVTATILTPDGTASDAFAKAGMQVRRVRGLSQFDNTRYGHYRRLRWIILLRELFLLPFSVVALWRIPRDGFDLLHVNEITLLPLALLAKVRLRVPMVVHVRSLQRVSGSGWRTLLVNRWLRRYADAVTAIDETVASTLDRGLPTYVIHNGLQIASPMPEIGDSHQRPHSGPTRVGFLGVLLALKGIFELVEAMRILRDRGVDIECWVAGENARELSGIKAWALRSLGFAHDVRSDLQALLTGYSLEGHVRLLGFVSDVHSVLPKLDILCFPSHLDAAGRPVFEAALYGIPSVVAIRNPKPDAIVHGVTGLAIPSADPVLIADALQQLAEDADYRRRLGEKARAWAAETFSIEQNAASMLAIYKRLTLANSDRAVDCAV